MSNLFQCPICGLPLRLHDASYQCDNHHHFDVAKEGYVNLLPANYRHSKAPGDSKAMILSRKEFLSRRYYEPLAAAISQMVARYAGDVPKMNILDAGCGEGYYVGYLQNQLARPGSYYGIDISKDAIRYAAKQYRAVTFAVASVAHLPIQDASVNCMLNVFAPRNSAEFSRVAGPDCLLLVVSPAADHLMELRALIYEQVKPYATLASDEFAPHFSRIDSQDVHYQMTLANPTDIGSLLQMTPFYWRTSPEKRERLLALQQLTTAAAFSLQLFRRDAGT